MSGSRRLGSALVLAGVMCLLAPVRSPWRLGKSCVWAQENQAETKTPKASPAGREPAAPSSLPHGKFLLDYLLVLLLIAGAIYAVCGFRRRV